jgi:rfaE bifunctional protein kinase chain/domain
MFNNKQSRSEIDFARTLINSTGIVDEIYEADGLVNLLGVARPDLIVRGHEFRRQDDQDNTLIRNSKIELKFASEELGLSEAELRDPYDSNLTIRKSFRDYYYKQGYSKEELKNDLNLLKGLKVNVIGDLIVDEYIECKTLGMSQEEPIVVSSPVAKARYLGGAGIVALHCSALGASTRLISRVGDGEVDRWAIEQLEKGNIAARLVETTSYNVPLKQRFKNGLHTLFRINHLPKNSYDDEYKEKIVKEVAENQDTQLWIFSDFSYGTFVEDIAEELVSIIRRDSRGTFIAADSQSSSQVGSLSKFAGSDLIAATEYEARLELNDRTTGLSVLSSMLLSQLKAKFALLKLGSDGCILSGTKPDGSIFPTELIPSANTRAFDTTGAGDSLLAVSATLMATGVNFHKATLLGSLGASIQVSKRGNTPISVDELIKLIDEI